MPAHADERLSLQPNCHVAVAAIRMPESDASPQPDALLPFALGGNSVTAPHIPWFVLPSTYRPMTNPGAPICPYSVGTSTESPDNPPGGPAAFDSHANIVRHWRSDPTTGLATPRFVIVVPNTVPRDATGGPDTSTTIQNTFPGLVANGAAANYRWKDWISDVQQAFAKYASINTAMISFIYDGAVYSTGFGAGNSYARSDGAPMFAPAPGAAFFIWGTDIGGPTGNDVNEIILTDQPIGGIGLTSMLVDPTNGEIVECDIILEVGATNASGPAGAARGLLQPSGPAGNPTTLPAEWTAIEHEIGHFYGLDHTNLHTGYPAPQAAPYGQMPVPTYVPINNVFPGAGIAPPTPTRARYPVALPIPLTAMPIPAMAGFITHLGVGTVVQALPIHRDEYVGLSQLYPVPMPRPGSARIPLINVSASIRGRITNSGAGSFGRNIWVLPQQNLDSNVPATMGTPTVGMLSGVSRLTNDPLVTSNRPWNPLLPLYLDDTTGNTPYFPTGTIPSVLGNPIGGGATGDFAVDGIPVTVPIGPAFQVLTAIDPIEYDIVFEDGRDLGVNVTPLRQSPAEWFTQIGVYGGNLMSPTVGWRPAMTFNTNGPVAGVLPCSSLSVMPGSVLYLNPKDTDEAFLQLALTQMATSGQTVTPSYPPGTPNPLPRFREPAVRPLVYITPRNGRASNPTVQVSVRLDEPFAALDPNLVRFFINGASTAVAPTVAPPPGVYVGPVTLTWTFATSSVIGGASSTTPVRLSVVAMPVPQPGQALIVDPDPATNGLLFTAAIGRNDVIL